MTTQGSGGQGPVDPRGAFNRPPPPHAMSSGPGGPMPPPPGMMPPGMYPPGGFPMGMMPPFPPPTPPRSSSFARGIFMTLATLVFSISIALNLYFLLIFGLSPGAGGGTVTSNVRSGDSSQKVVIIPLSGIIDGNMTRQVQRYFDQAERDSNVKAVVLEMDTPGGEVTASDIIMNRVVQFRNSAPGRKVVVSIGSLGASGGYYVACGADKIVANRTSLTGSIGVLFSIYNASALAEKWGIEDRSVTADGNDFKLSGSLLRPATEKDTLYFRALVNDAMATFRGVVEKGRGTRLVGKPEDVFSARIFSAKEALALGLIDSIGYLDDAIDLAASEAGLTKPTVVRYQSPPSLLQLFGASAAQLSSAVSGNPGLNIHIDASVIDHLSRPRLMYLWRE